MLAVVTEQNTTLQTTSEDFVFYVMAKIDTDNINLLQLQTGILDPEKLDDVTKLKIIEAIKERNKEEPDNQGSVHPNDWKLYLTGNTQEIETQSPFRCSSPSVLVDVKRASIQALRVPPLS